MTYKAKRGDLALIERVRHVTYVHGPSERSSQFELIRVTNVTRDGLVTGYEYGMPYAPGNTLQCKPRAGITYPCTIVPADKVNAFPLWNALRGHEFASLDEAREAILPYKLEKVAA